jgi:hypothetical protein
MIVSASGEILFSWLHLSDIHVGHGSATHGWDQMLVLQRLREDIEHCLHDMERRFPCYPWLNAVLITGDLAFSGGSKRKHPMSRQGEYAAAGKWLDEVCRTLGLDRDRVWMVPGNHDIDRGVDEKDGNIRRLVDAIRTAGPGALDAELAKRKERGYLAKRLAAYLDFAASYARVSAPEGTQDRRKHPFFWTDVVPVSGLQELGLELHLVGLNTVLVGGRTDDEGRLQVGKQQLVQCLPERNDRRVVLALSHHPVSWLADSREVGNALHARAHVHLCGHVHDAGTEELRRGGGRGLVTIAAGAVHSEQSEDPAGHGFGFGALCAVDGALVVRVWPRRWHPDSQRFVADTSRTRDDRVYVDHRLDVRLREHRVDGAVREPATPARPDMRDVHSPSHASLSRVHLILDRTHQWERLVNRCMLARDHLAFLVHGNAAQDVGAFVHRVEQYLEEASRVPHRTWRVPLRSDGMTARTVIDWDLHLRRATGFASTRSLAQVLSRAAQQERLLLIFAEEPLKNLDAEQAEALAAFLSAYLPRQLREAQPRHPVHLLVAVEHAGPRTPTGDDVLVDMLDAALRRATGLILEPLIELTFPTWEEVKAQIRQELGHLAPVTMNACRERYDAIAAAPNRSYRTLASVLAELLDTVDIPL